MVSKVEVCPRLTQNKNVNRKWPSMKCLHSAPKKCYIFLQGLWVLPAVGNSQPGKPGAVQKASSKRTEFVKAHVIPDDVSRMELGRI